ncbi:50S ribosomal protein L25 [Candidatus Dojkabacteria bacterium]|uniref:Large ribosomal subunit protein bL25 n=1 Tax=Candidatus Dojkabacteria bacterium TaxID=2099670 RepID=A0A847VEG4_9BACT|nr:50S ribosomal protein L25 [Candidatus Dojkabacteria bacterium]
METLLLNKRDARGKKVKQLRKEGVIPAVVYNAKGDSTNVSLSETDANWLLRNTTSTSIIDAKLDKKEFKTVVKEFDLHPVTEKVNHVSLFQIDEDAPMTFTLPFNIVGTAPAVKNNLGVMVNVLDSIEVRCTLKDLVPFIEVDVSNLNHPGETIALDDLDFPKGMSLMNEELQSATIVTITELQKEEEIIVEDTEEEEIPEGEEVPEGEEIPEGEGREQDDSQPTSEEQRG